MLSVKWYYNQNFWERRVEHNQSHPIVNKFEQKKYDFINYLRFDCRKYEKDEKKKLFDGMNCNGCNQNYEFVSEQHQSSLAKADTYTFWYRMEKQCECTGWSLNNLFFSIFVYFFLLRKLVHELYISITTWFSRWRRNDNGIQSFNQIAVFRFTFETDIFSCIELCVGICAWFVLWHAKDSIIKEC